MVFSNNLLMGAGGQASGYEIDQSIRFNDDDSAYLNRTPGSAGNRRTFTFSCWVKRGNITGANGPIFSAGGDDWLMFLSANTLGFNSDGSNNYRIVTTQLFRDPGAWTHVVLRIDTTNATAGDRERLYINGSEVTDFGTDTNPPLNYDTAFNNTGEHSIGKVVGSSQFFDGYLAEIHHVDGSSLAASSFGETNDDGVWVPKAYSGSYGTNGFYIDGRDSSDLGDDESGNGNDYASSGLAAADQMSDSPTNNHSTLNPLSNGTGGATSDGNLKFSTTSSATGTMVSTIPVSSGKWYCEVTVTTGSANGALGIRSITQSSVTSNTLGNQTLDYAYRGNGQKFNSNTKASYGTSYTTNAVIGIALDLDDGTIKFLNDNSDQGTAYSSISGTFVFAVGDDNSSSAFAGTFNFGASSFTYTPPTGYKALNTANLPTPTISDPSKYVQADLYTAQTTGFSPTFDGNSDLAPDFLWFKRRDGASNNFLFDKVRGVNLGILSDSTATEATYTNSLTAFGTDGFTLGDGGSSNDINGVSGATYVAWGWAAGGTSGSTNEDGSVDSTVTANTTAGFSIVKWVHTTSANYTVGHGLGATPKMVIVKTLDQGTNWGVYHSDITTGNRLILNTNATQGTGYWGANTWNSTVFSIGSIRDANSSNAIAYVFAEVEGFSKFGSYTGNGNADGPFVYTGFTPSIIIFKNASVAYNWDMRDSKRDPLNPNTFYLSPSLSDAEATSSDGVDFLSNGFKYRSSGATANGSGNTIIYAAFAEHPFGGDGIAPATAR